MPLSPPEEVAEEAKVVMVDEVEDMVEEMVEEMVDPNPCFCDDGAATLPQRSDDVATT